MAPTPHSAFQTYFDAIATEPKYQRSSNLYILTDTKDKKHFYDIGLMVQTPQPKQPDGMPFAEEQNVETRNFASLPVLEGIRKYANQHVLLVGKPGSGKSTALERLLLEEAELCLKPEKRKIPVLIELRSWRSSVVDLIQKFFRRHKLRLSTDKIDDLLFEEQLFLLFDGLNELPSDEARREVADFRENNPEIPMIFTTRDLGVGGDLGIKKQLEMQPLTEQQMRSFVTAYLPQQGDEMLRQLSDRLRELGQTPLILKMLCEVFDSAKQVPKSRGALFHWFDREFDKLKGVVPIAEGLGRWKSELLQHLAFVIMQGENPNEKPTDFRLSISREKAEAVLEDFLKNRVDSPGEKAKDWLQDLLRHYLIQTGADREQIEFHHQLFQEYYAAEYLLRLLEPHPLTPSPLGRRGENGLSDAKLKRDYLNLLKWTEPLALMLGLVEDEAQAVRVVQLALDVDLMLGARLAGEVRCEFQEKTVGLILGLDVREELKIELLSITGSEKAIPTLLQAMREENPNVLRSAINALGKIGSEAAIPTLTKALEDNDFDIGTNAAEALGRINSDVGLSKLIELLKSKNLNVCIYAAQALGETANEIAVMPLLEVLNHNDSGVCGSTAEALGKIGSKKAVPSLIKTLEREGFWVSESAAYALGEIAAEEAVLALLEALKNKALRIERFAQLVENISSELVVSIMQDLKSANHSFLKAVTWALKKISSEITVPLLQEALKHQNHLIRANAAFALGEIGTVQVAHALLETLKDKHPWVRVQSAHALGQIGNKIAIPALIESLNDEIPLVRANIVTALGQICTDDIMPTLLKALKDDDSLVRANAAYALGKIGTDKANQGLLLALTDINATVRKSAILALEQLNDDVGIDELLLALNDEDPWVRSFAAETLGKSNTEKVIKRLLLVLKDSNPSLRRSAIKGLMKIGTEQVGLELTEVLKDKELYVRLDAASALATIANSKTLATIKDLMLNKDETYLLHTIEEIQICCKFYNHDIFHSPLVEEDKTESQPSNLQNTYNFYGNAGILNTGDVRVQGNQIGEQYNK